MLYYNVGQSTAILLDTYVFVLCLLSGKVIVDECSFIRYIILVTKCSCISWDVLYGVATCICRMMVYLDHCVRCLVLFTLFYIVHSKYPFTMVQKQFLKIWFSLRLHLYLEADPGFWKVVGSKLLHIYSVFAHICQPKFS